jgi:hypothetical protein
MKSREFFQRIIQAKIVLPGGIHFCAERNTLRGSGGTTPAFLRDRTTLAYPALKRSDLGSGLEFGGFGEAQFALGQGEGEEFFDLCLFATTGHSEFANQKVAGTFQHLLFAER